MLVLTTSPRRGNGDMLAELLTQRLTQIKYPVEQLALRDHAVQPCTACGFCASATMQCIFDQGSSNDAGTVLLQQLLHAPALLLIAPIYFYGPPALFKALIDRAQMVWEAQRQGVEHTRTPRPAYMAFIAAREEGPRLFEASGLIVRNFLRHMGFVPQPPLELRGLDAPEALAKSTTAHSIIGQWVESVLIPTLPHYTNIA